MRVEIELTDKLKEYVDDYIDIGGGDNVFCYPDNIIKAIREGIERQTGKWEFALYNWERCSICGYADKFADKWNYCPNCGAKMENVEKSLIDIKMKRK